MELTWTIYLQYLAYIFATLKDIVLQRGNVLQLKCINILCYILIMSTYLKGTHFLTIFWQVLQVFYTVFELYKFNPIEKNMTFCNHIYIASMEPLYNIPSQETTSRIYRYTFINDTY